MNSAIKMNIAHITAFLAATILTVPATEAQESSNNPVREGMPQAANSRQKIKKERVSPSRLRTGDFDGDGIPDLFTTWGGSCRVSSGGKGEWKKLNVCELDVKDLRFGDFNGDAITDVFGVWAGKWWVSFGGSSSWIQWNVSNHGIKDLRFGNFNADRKTDVYSQRTDGGWQVSPSGFSPWVPLALATPPDPNLGVSGWVNTIGDGVGKNLTTPKTE